MIRRILLALLALSAGSSLAAATMNWPDLTGRPRPAADARIVYGADPLQHVDLWLPQGAGPFPVVVMVHGGCWRSSVARADIMNWIADDLRKRGIAVWNIEYRGVDRPGGGYPGTFLDAAAAADALRGEARKYRLKLDRVIVLGHSAGGHLALWLAARGGLPRGSALYRPHPLPIAAALSLGGLPDLEAAAAPPGDTCGAEAVRKLVGEPDPTRRDVFADTSPPRLPRPRATVTLVNGGDDPIAPPPFAIAYAAKVRATGARIDRIAVADTGHVELIAPETPAWAATVRRIERALGKARGHPDETS